MWQTVARLSVLGFFLVGPLGCHSSPNAQGGLFATGPTRVPPPTTGSYGKAAKYYPPVSTANGAAPAAPAPTSGASTTGPAQPTTTLPTPPPTAIVPAVHSDEAPSGAPSYPVAPAAANGSSTAPLRWTTRN